jgi:hypothetical protein
MSCLGVEREDERDAEQHCGDLEGMSIRCGNVLNLKSNRWAIRCRGRDRHIRQIMAKHEVRQPRVVIVLDNGDRVSDNGAVRERELSSIFDYSGRKRGTSQGVSNLWCKSGGQESREWSERRYGCVDRTVARELRHNEADAVVDLLSPAVDGMRPAYAGEGERLRHVLALGGIEWIVIDLFENEAKSDNAKYACNSQNTRPPIESVAHLLDLLLLHLFACFKKLFTVAAHSPHTDRLLRTRPLPVTPHSDSPKDME